MKYASTTGPWLSASPFTKARPEEEAADPLAGGLRVPGFPAIDDPERKDEAELDRPKRGKLEVDGIASVNVRRLPWLATLPTPVSGPKTRFEKFARVLSCFEKIFGPFLRLSTPDRRGLGGNP